MDNKDGLDWDRFLDEALNEQSTHTVMDTAIRNPGDDILSDLDVAALETWVQENSTMDMDAPDCRQDHSQSPPRQQIYRPRGSLSALGPSMSFDELASEMQILKQAIDNESQALGDFSKLVDDAHAKVEEVSSMVNTTLRRVARLKAVYDQLIQWSLDMQGAVAREAHRNGLTVVDH